jgi:hypothetical protein
MTHHATIVVRRQRHSLNSMIIRFTVRIDGQDVATVRDGKSVAVSVAPGLHAVEVHAFGYQASRSVTVHLAEGQTAALNCRPGVLLNAYRVQLETDPAPMSVEHTEGVRPAAPRVDCEVLEVRETHRGEEALGVEYRDVANSSRMKVARTIRACREWSRTLTIDNSMAVTGRGSVGFGPAWLQVQAAADAELRRTYSISDSERQEFSEEVAFEVDPNSHVRLTLHWKKLWQYGDVVVRGRDGAVISLPYRVLVGITFDQAFDDARR